MVWNQEDSFRLFLGLIFCLDKFQGLIQMKDAATAQSVKMVNIE